MLTNTNKMKQNNTKGLQFGKKKYGYYPTQDPESSSYTGNDLSVNFEDLEEKSSGGLFKSIGNFFSGIGENFANVYRTINRDIDENDKLLAEQELGYSRQDLRDLQHIDEYNNLLQQKKDIISSINDNEDNYEVVQQLYEQLNDVQQRIYDLDNYFTTEGRSHKLLSKIMFSMDNLSPEENVAMMNRESNSVLNPLREFKQNMFKRAEEAKTQSDLEAVSGEMLIGGIAAVASTALNGVSHLAEKLWNGFSAPFKDKDIENNHVTDYVRYATDGDPIINKAYRGESLSLSKDKISEYLAEAAHDVEKKTEDVKDAQDALMSGRMFGINNAYNYDKVSPEWIAGREYYQNNNSFISAPLHPFYATADVASSLDMMRYSIYAGLYDAGVRSILKRAPQLFGKKAPYLGWVLTASDIAAGIGSVVKSREEETALEAAGGLSARSAKEAMKNNVDLQQVLDAIKEDANKIGLSTEGMSDEELIQLGVLIDTDTGINQFEQSKQKVRRGLNKLINANNALALSDYLQTIPYMSYFGDAIKAVKIGGAQPLAEVGEKMDHIIERTFDRAARRFIKDDAPKSYLHAKHFTEYAAKKSKKIIGTSILEGIEEGQQQILTTKFERGDYDDYNKNTRIFDIGEIAGNINLGKDALLAYMGISDFSDSDENAIRTAMNIGFWSSVIQSQGMHAITNLAGPSEDNVRGLVRQFKDDNLAVRLFSDFQKKQQDAMHVEMFLDRFKRGSDGESILKSLNDMKDFLSPYQPEPTIKYKDYKGKEQETTLSNAKRILTDDQFLDATGKTKDEFTDPRTTLVKSEYIDGDIRLMLNAWQLFNDNELTRSLDKEGVKKSSDAYKQFIIDGATKLSDFQEVSQKMSEGQQDINAKREIHKQLIQTLLSDDISDKDRAELIKKYPKLAKTAEFLKKMHEVHIKQYNQKRGKKFQELFKGVTSVNKLLKGLSDKDLIQFANSLSSNTYEDRKDAENFIKSNKTFSSSADGLNSLKDSVFEFLEERGFIEELDKNKKKFISNIYVLDQLDGSDYKRERLSAIFDRGGKEKEDILKKAAKKGIAPISLEDFVITQTSAIHNWKARKMLQRQLAWIDDEKQALSVIRKITGLDIDPSRIQGWLDYFKESLNRVHKNEKDFLGFGRDYDSVFNEDDVSFDDDLELDALTRDFYINGALKNAISPIAQAYLTLNTSPDLLSKAAFGKQSDTNILDIFIKEEQKIKDKIKNRRESEQIVGEGQITEDEIADLEAIKKSAAISLIKQRIREAERRRKITHRELQEQREARIQQVIRGTLQQDEDAVVQTGESSEIRHTAEEDYLRKVYAWEQYKDNKKKREERKRKRAERNKEKEEKNNQRDSSEQNKDEKSSKNNASSNTNRQINPSDSPSDENSQNNSGIIQPSTQNEQEQQQQNITGEQPINNNQQNQQETVDDAIEDTETSESPSQEGGGANISSTSIIPGDQDDGTNIDDIFNEDDDVVMGVDDEDPSAEEDVSTEYNDPSAEEELGSEDISELYSDPSAEEDVYDDDPSSYEELLPEWYGDDFVQAETEPIHPETEDAQDVADITGKPDINLLWQTMNYDPNATNIPIVKVNDKVITEIHGKPIKPGSELSKKLLEKGWLAKADKYYIVTQSEQAKTSTNKEDAFTVALVIEDENNTYLCYYRSLGNTISISTKTGDVYNINDRARLRNKLLLRHMDIDKVFKFLEDFRFTLFAKDNSLQQILNEQQTIKAYNKAVMEYAHQLYVRDHRITDYRSDNESTVLRKVERDWNIISSTQARQGNETQEQFEERSRKNKAILSGYLFAARKHFSNGQNIIYSNSQIEKELDRLQEARNKIIDAYLEKRDGQYIFPEELQIGKVRPESVSQSNGTFDNQKENGGVLPKFRHIVPEGANLLQIQSDLDKGVITIGIGKGPRPKRGNANAIVRYGFKVSGEEEVLFRGKNGKKSGIAGKLYLMVPQLTNGKPVPVMLSEEKFDTQQRSGSGGVEDVKINNSNKVRLCIDPVSKLIDQNAPYRPSAAEVLLYMILGELDMPADVQTEDAIRLFINCDANTLLKTQPNSESSDFVIALSAKQLYYGPDVVDKVETTASGKKIVRKVQKEGTQPMFHIGLPQSMSHIETINGQQQQITKTVYIETVVSKEQILQDTELRQKIVQAIATQMHWNTDDETFQESASISASSTALGNIVKYLMQKYYEEGKFDNMSTEQIMNQTVSIANCPQLSFRIGDFYTVEKNANDQLVPTPITNASVLAWMLKSGRIKTNVSEQIWKDPYIFSSGVVVSEDYSNLKEQPVVENKDDVPDQTEEDAAVFYNEQKEKRIISNINQRFIKTLNLPKTIKEAKEKIKTFVEFLKSDKSQGKLVGFSEIDPSKDEILDIIVLENTSKDKLIEYDDDLTDQSEDKEFDDVAKKQLEDTVKLLVNEYNKSNKSKISEVSIKNTKAFTQMLSKFINAAVIYKTKDGKIKCIVSSVSTAGTQDKGRINPTQAHYTIQTATGVFSKTKTKGEFEENRARAWLSNVLGIDPTNVYVWDSAINASVDPDVQGSVDVIVDSLTQSLVGTIGLNRSGGSSVHYHEAWHYVNLLLHSEQERNRMYDIYVKSHKNLKGQQKSAVEEEMAEAFRNWMILQQDNSLKGILKRTWNNILDFVILWNGKREYKRVFRNIATGKYKKQSPSYKNLLNFKREWQQGAHSIDYFTQGLQEQEREDFEFINTHQQFFNTSRAIARYIIQQMGIRTKEDIRRVNKKMKHYEEIEKIIDEWINDPESPLTEENRNFLKDVAKNKRLVKQAITDEFGQLGLKAKIRTHKDYKKHIQNIPEDQLDKGENAGQTATDVEDTFKADNTWDKFELSMSKKDKMSTLVKLFFMQIPVYIDGEKQYDDYGIVKTYAFSEAWNKIMENLWYCESLSKRNKDGYLPNSMMGIIEYLKDADEFFASLYDMLTGVVTDGDVQFSAIKLRSQLYSLINSNKPDVSYLQLSDPRERYYDDDDQYDMLDDDNIIRSNLVQDTLREWQMRSGNEDEVARNLPRNWSKELTAHGFTVVRDGKTVVSDKFVEKIKTSLSAINAQLKAGYKENTFEQLCDDIVSFYKQLAIPLDKRSLDILIQMYSKDTANLSNKSKFDIIKSWFIQEEDGKASKTATIPAIAEQLINHAGKDSLSYTQLGDKRIRAIDQAFDNYDKGSYVYKLAIAINRIHPSSREFSTIGPNGERIYPISQNSFISDRLRQLSQHGKDYSKIAIQNSPYAAGSEILQISSQLPEDSIEAQFRLKAFVGIKDRSRNHGADYFGITPMEDYLAKLMMTEGLEKDSSDNMLVLPTMADKKTWYAIYSKKLRLCHGLVHSIMDSKYIDQAIYDEYEKIDATDKEKYRASWEYDAKQWFKQQQELADSGNADAISIVNRIEDAQNELMKKDNVVLDKFDSNTISWFYKYLRSEFDAIEQYYSAKNIQRCVDKPHTLLENYHGNIFTTKDGQVRMDISGNGGKLRYFYDIFQFKDSSSDKSFNFNQRLQYLYELQKKIEAGKVKNLDESDPLYPLISQGSFSNKQQLDGFELVRLEIDRIKQKYFYSNLGLEDKELQEKLNSLLISCTAKELNTLADKTKPYHIINKDSKTGLYTQLGIPQQLLLKYINKLSGKSGVRYSDLENVKDERLIHNAIVSLIGNYVVNSAISVIEFEKVFSGDPAYYTMKSSGKEKMTQLVTFSDGKISEETVEVDVITDTFSDKIKRLGSLLSPGDEQRLDFTEEELAKYPELQVTDYTVMNVEDIHAQSIFDSRIESMFKTQLLIDHIRLIDDTKFRKIVADKNLKYEEAIRDLYGNREFFQEVYDEYSEMHDAVDKQVEKQINPYRDINTCDAQAFIRPQLYRKIRIALGQWTSTDEKAYKILEQSEQSGDMSWMNDEKKYKIVRQLELFPLKMTYFDNDPQRFFKSCTPNLNKMAVFSMFKFQATSDTGRKIYQRMNKHGNEIDMMVFKSAAKVGSTKYAVKMLKDGTSTEDQMCNIDDMFDLNNSRWIDYRRRWNEEKKEWELSDTYGQVQENQAKNVAPVKIQNLKYLRMQLNTEHHEEDFRNMGTQMFKLSFSNIMEDAYYGDRTGKQIKDEIISTIKELTNLGVLDIRRRFFSENEDGTFSPNVEKIHNFITEIAQSNGIGESAVSLLKSGYKAASSSSRMVFENSVTNVVNSDVVDIETQGGTAIQQSVFGFVGHGKHQITDQRGALALNYNNGEELIWDQEGGTMEVMLSMNFFRNILPKEMKDKSFIKQRRWLIDHDIIKGEKLDGTQSNPKPFGIGYRIPTQGMSSMFGFTVADVLPPTVGDLIVVPREFTAQTGSDYDVDKIFLTTFTRNANGEILTEKDLAIGEDKNTVDNDQLGDLRKQVLVNKLLKNYITLITDVANYADARASIDVLTSTLRKDFVGKVIRGGDLQYVPSFTELSPSFQIDKKREFSAGKNGIAPFALNVTNLSLTQIAHLTMRYDGVISEYGFGALDQIYGRGVNKNEKVRIAAWLSAMVNAHVDVAKDPYVFDLNINQVTYNYANFLIRAGMGMSTFTFLAQESLKNVADRINNAGGMYGGNLTGLTAESDIYKKRRRSIVLGEFKDLQKKLEVLSKSSNLTSEQQKRIAELNAYAGYKSKSYHSEEEKENIPDLKFERNLVFDDEYGKTMILAKKSDNIADQIDYIEYQLACLRGFQEISPYADNISKLVSASQIDTKKFGNTIADHINYANKILHLFEDGDLWTINEDGFEDQFTGPKGGIDRNAVQKAAITRYLEESYLMDKFKSASDLCREILKTELLVAQDEFTRVFNDVLGEINGTTKIEDDRGLSQGVITNLEGNMLYNAELKQDKVKAMAQAIDSAMRFNAMFNGAMYINEQLNPDAIDFTCGGDINKVIQTFSIILYGSDKIDPLYKRLADFKEKASDPKNAETYWDLLDENGEFVNEFLKMLVPQSPTEERPVGIISLYESLLDQDSAMEKRLISAFSQLLYSSNKEASDLAKDLVFYSYYSGYDNNTLNSFFHLVPAPFREQYDKALSRMIDDLNSTNDETKNNASSRINSNTYDIIDIICRNYWYDDEITPRFYLKNGWSDPTFQHGNEFYGEDLMYEGVGGFPQFICVNNKNTDIKNSMYFKVTRSGKSLLYKRVGNMIRTNKESGKSHTIGVYLPVQKAGMLYRGAKFFEFYATEQNASVYKSNRLPAKMGHDLLRQKLEKMAETANSVQTNKYEIEFSWASDQVQNQYVSTNRNTYEPFQEGEEVDVLDRVSVQPAKEVKDNFYKDPIIMGVDQSVVTLDISAGDPTISFKEEAGEETEEFVSTEKELDEKTEKKKFTKQVRTENKDKVVNINPNNPITDRLYNHILDVIQNSVRNQYPYVFINISDLDGVEITENDRQSYINDWLGEEQTKQAKKALAKMEYFDRDVRQWKINVFIKNVLDRILQEENIKVLTVTAAAYGSSHIESARAVQFYKQTHLNVTDGVYGLIYTSARLFRNKKLYNKFRYAMTKAAQVFNPEAVSTITQQISDLKEKQNAIEHAANEVVVRELDKIKKEAGADGEQQPNFMLTPTNPELDSINKDDEESQKHKECDSEFSTNVDDFEW